MVHIVLFCYIDLSSVAKCLSAQDMQPPVATDVVATEAEEDKVHVGQVMLYSATISCHFNNCCNFNNFFIVFIICDQILENLSSTHKRRMNNYKYFIQLEM